MREKDTHTHPACILRLGLRNMVPTAQSFPIKKWEEERNSGGIDEAAVVKLILSSKS